MLRCADHLATAADLARYITTTVVLPCAVSVLKCTFAIRPSPIGRSAYQGPFNGNAGSRAIDHRSAWKSAKNLRALAC